MSENIEQRVCNRKQIATDLIECSESDEFVKLGYMAMIQKQSENTNFEHIIGVLFNNWTALKLAVEHGMGGSSEVMQFKISDLIQNVHEYLHKSGDSMCWTAISDIIEDVMDVGFDVVLEDSSADDLSRHICKLYCDWNQSDGRQKVIDELKNLPVTIPIQVVPVRPIREKQKKDDSSSEESESSDDGWTVVKHK